MTSSIPRGDQNGQLARSVTPTAQGHEADNLIVHVAKLLCEDISISYKSTDVSLRQPPINDDDHDSWGGYEKLEDWYYVAYSIIHDLDPQRAVTALSDLVATDQEASND